jgi:hypothetical protein
LRAGRNITGLVPWFWLPGSGSWPRREGAKIWLVRQAQRVNNKQSAQNKNGEWKTLYGIMHSRNKIGARLRR